MPARVRFARQAMDLPLKILLLLPVRAYVRAYVRACGRACVGGWVRATVRAGGVWVGV